MEQNSILDHWTICFKLLKKNSLRKLFLELFDEIKKTVRSLFLHSWWIFPLLYLAAFSGSGIFRLWALIIAIFLTFLNAFFHSIEFRKTLLFFHFIIVRLISSVFSVALFYFIIFVIFFLFFPKFNFFSLAASLLLYLAPILMTSGFSVLFFLETGKVRLSIINGVKFLLYFFPLILPCLIFFYGITIVLTAILESFFIGSSCSLYAILDHLTDFIYNPKLIELSPVYISLLFTYMMLFYALEISLFCWLYRKLKNINKNLFEKAPCSKFTFVLSVFLLISVTVTLNYLQKNSEAFQTHQTVNIEQTQTKSEA